MVVEAEMIARLQNLKLRTFGVPGSENALEKASPVSISK